jgi:hypothetical protein
MSTEIQARLSNIIDAGIDASYFSERGFTVTLTQKNGQRFRITLAEDLTDAEKDALELDLRIDLALIDTDVSDGGETEITTKKRYMRVMDRCMETIIRRGFVFQTETFSLGLAAQVRLLRYHVIRANLTYPFAVANIENTGGIQVNDAAEMQDLFVAAHTSQFATEQDAITNKTTVRNAASKAAARTAAETYLTTNGCAFLIPMLGA